MNQEGPSKKKRIQAGAGVAVVGVIVVGAAIATSSKHSNVMASGTSSGTATTTSSTNSNATYKNGTYNATGTYDSPGGQESIKLSLTLDNNVVTATSATAEANDPTATSYQDLFIGAYKTKVIGKKISSINLSNVSGSSLTSQGFDNALQQIEKQAKS
jgi:uncharacterized protein with FMN-binding domain